VKRSSLRRLLAVRRLPALLVGITIAAAASAASAGDASGSKPAPLAGQAVYEALCYGCHRDGLGGAPKFGDAKAWQPRIAQGYDVLVGHAVKGFAGKSGTMPPRGGGSYSDEEVARAVAYMANHAGASFPQSSTLANRSQHGAHDRSIAAGSPGP